METSKATPRQLWALYCITKKDYRNSNLTKEEAAKLIAEVGSPDYKKTKKASKTLSEELLEYLTENFDKMFDSAIKSLNYRSVATSDKRQYIFIGVGCGITYPVYRKNNKKLKEIDEAAYKYHWNEIKEMFMSKFSNKDIEYYENIGSPLEAIWSQDQGMQVSYWEMVKKFAESKGLKMQIRTMLD